VEWQKREFWAGEGRWEEGGGLLVKGLKKQKWGFEGRCGLIRMEYGLVMGGVFDLLFITQFPKAN
jgi:hypothetical protein